MKNFFIRFFSILYLILLINCVGMNGVVIPLSHAEIPKSKQKMSGKLSVERPATDSRPDRENIGKATFSLFAIPVGDISTTSPVGEQMADLIFEELTSLGYQVDKSQNDKSDKSKNDGRIKLKIIINELWFENYNWFYPIVPTWGDIRISVSLENTKGKKIFEKSYIGEGKSYCLPAECGFSDAIKEAMTQIMQDFTSDFSSQKVQASITSGEPAP
ncbi:MAG: hypothetical protein SFU98_17035 [Leptospiraceae bacterium]|nr:hypothetical protein [Leptospiraceae bacterium]